MEASPPVRLLRDILAVLVVAMFMFPLFFWALTSIKPTYAIFDKDRINWFDYQPTLANYKITMLGQSDLINDSGGTVIGEGSANSYDSRMSVLESVIIAVGSTLISVTIAMLAALRVVTHVLQRPERLSQLGAWATVPAAHCGRHSAADDLSRSWHARHGQCLSRYAG